MIDFDLLQETPATVESDAQYGVQVTDSVESETFEMYFEDLGTFHGAPEGAFSVPIDSAVELEVDKLELPNLVDLFFRVDRDLVETAGTEEASLPPNQYEIEVSTAPIKLYIRTGVTDVTVRSPGVTILDFDTPTTIQLGARSHHRQPAGTITTPRDPEDLAAAVSYFGSALKTTSPERSFPTLRGHPPLLEFGDTFDVPDGIHKPETGVTIEVPDDPGSIFQVTPLAYYLGADLEIGSTSALHLPDSTVTITGEDSHPSANEVLTHVFLMDCAVRPAGLYSSPLQIHQRAVDELGIDADWLYSKPLAERVDSYLRYEIGALNDHIRWPSTVDIEPRLEHVEFLPFIANELAWVRSPPPEVSSDVPGAYPSAVTGFMRSQETPQKESGGREDQGKVVSDVVSPIQTESIGHAWVGDQIPLKAAKPVASSYRERSEREPTKDGEISVTVVCNETQMQSETEDLYGHREVPDIDVDVVIQTSTEELRAILHQDDDLLHFVGHVDDEGLQCTDGYLDTESVTDVSVDSFVLNGCRSYQQGMDLVEAGCAAGVVTLADVDNRVATEAGRRIARLLDYGFDLYGALDMVQQYVTAGGHYAIVGDGRFMLTPSSEGVVLVNELETAQFRPEADVFPVTLHGYPTKRFGLGTMTLPYLGDDETRYLSSGEMATIEVSKEELEGYLESEQWPLVVDGDLQWSTEVTVDQLV